MSQRAGCLQGRNAHDLQADLRLDSALSVRRGVEDDERCCAGLDVDRRIPGHREGGLGAIDFYSEWKAIYVDYSDKLQKAQIDRGE